MAVRTDSASSPRQYRNVLTCFTATSAARHDATWNCSYRLRHLGHPSGDLKLNGPGGANCTPDISSVRPPLPPCNVTGNTA